MIFPGGVKRIEATFTDEDENAYNPTSQTLKFYDSLGTLIDEKDEDDCVNPGAVVGTWYIDYTIAADAETGRWVCL